MRFLGLHSPMSKRPGPALFRVLVSATDLPASVRFYASLLGTPGRHVAEGRWYFDCGAVILGVLDASESAPQDRTSPAEAIYFATDSLEAVHHRAARLGCLATDFLHGDPQSPMGGIVVRPWGERSFYAQDPAGNPLCFVDRRTCFTGSARQVAALRRHRTGAAPRAARRAPRRAGPRRPRRRA